MATLKTAASVSRGTQAVTGSPVGPLTLVACDGRLAAVHLSGHAHPPPGHADSPADGPDAELLACAAEQLAEYFAGNRVAFSLPLALAGTPFQQSVWQALRDIPYGQTVSYGQLAGRIGKPSASRAVGLANGRNPISIIVPCHRVIGSDGSLAGYGGGIERKRFLLALEQRVSCRPAAEPGAGAAAPPRVSP